MNGPTRFGIHVLCRCGATGREARHACRPSRGSVEGRAVGSRDRWASSAPNPTLAPYEASDTTGRFFQLDLCPEDPAGSEGCYGKRFGGGVRT